MRRIPFLLPALVAAAAHTGAAAQPAPRPFVGPDRLFTLAIPLGWAVQTSPTPEGPITWLASGRANVTVMAWRLPRTRAAAPVETLLEGLAQPYLDGWLRALRDKGPVRARPVTHTRFLGYPALRLDVTYWKHDADDPRTGYALFALGGGASYFVTANARAGAPGIAAADAIVATLRPGGGR
jgi:hypothetical protein